MQRGGADDETHISLVLPFLFLSTVLGASILPVQPVCFTGDSIVCFSDRNTIQTNPPLEYPSTYSQARQSMSRLSPVESPSIQSTFQK